MARLPVFCPEARWDLGAAARHTLPGVGGMASRDRCIADSSCPSSLCTMRANRPSGPDLEDKHAERPGSTPCCHPRELVERQAMRGLADIKGASAPTYMPWIRIGWTTYCRYSRGIHNPVQLKRAVSRPIRFPGEAPDVRFPAVRRVVILRRNVRRATSGDSGRPLRTYRSSGLVAADEACRHAVPGPAQVGLFRELRDSRQTGKEP
jgi:hypothetical protein